MTTDYWETFWLRAVDSYHKAEVHVKVRVAIEQGKLVREPCIVCGDLKTHAHHEDYNKPFDVVWLCTVHHNKLHWERRQSPRSRLIALSRRLRAVKPREAPM